MQKHRCNFFKEWCHLEYTSLLYKLQGSFALMYRIKLLSNPILYYVLPEQVGKQDHTCNFHLEPVLMRHSDGQINSISNKIQRKNHLYCTKWSIYTVESNFLPISRSFEIPVCQISQFELNCISENKYKKEKLELRVSWKVKSKLKISKSVSAIDKKPQKFGSLC